MNKKIFFLVFLLLLISLIYQVGAEKISSEVEKELRNNKEVNVIVKFRNENTGIGVARIGFKSARNELENKGFKEKTSLESFNAVSGEINETVLEELKNDPIVENVQLDHEFKIALDDSTKIINSSWVNNLVLKNNITGLGLGVCVLDTGVNYSHAGLGGCFGNGCRVVDGYDFINNDNDPYDDQGHGTHVTGIVNRIAPGAKIIHIKVLNSGGGGSESGISAGIDWCVNNKTKYNITAVSMSIGTDSTYMSYCDSTYLTLTNAVNNAIKKNITVFAASGNNGNTTAITSPGCIQNVTSVGGTTKSDSIAVRYTNRNNLLDLLAPGSDIISTTMSGGYGSMSGTSMATPHAAAVTALLQQYSYEQDKSYLSPYNVQSILNNSGKLIENWRRVNIKEAIASVDSIKPEIYLDSPINGTVFNSMNNISLNFTAKDSFLDKLWYNIDGVNNISLNENISFFPLGGRHVLSLFANDTKGNVNFTKINLGLDIPRVILKSPDDNLNSLNGNIVFNCSASDISGLSNISLIHDLSGEWKINQTKITNKLQDNASFNLNFSGNLTFNWNCISYDNSGFLALDNNRTLRVNFNNIPLISSFFPNRTNVEVNEPENQSFNVSYSDINGDLLSVRWYLNNNLVSEVENYTFIGGYSSNGSYNVTAYVNDSLSYNSTYWNFNVINTEVCGDNVKNSTEGCDGSDFGGDSCDSRGYNSGSLSCSSCSSIDANDCKNVNSDGGGGGGSGGGTSITRTENLEPAPVAKSSPNIPDLETASENIEVKEESKEEKTDENIPKVEFIKSGWFSRDNIRTIVISGIAGVLAVFAIIFFFRKEYLLIKGKNKDVKEEK